MTTRKMITVVDTTCIDVTTTTPILRMKNQGYNYHDDDEDDDDAGMMNRIRDSVWEHFILRQLSLICDFYHYSYSIDTDMDDDDSIVPHDDHPTRYPKSNRHGNDRIGGLTIYPQQSLLPCHRRRHQQQHHQKNRRNILVMTVPPQQSQQRQQQHHWSLGNCHFAGFTLEHLIHHYHHHHHLHHIAGSTDSTDSSNNNTNHQTAPNIRSIRHPPDRSTNSSSSSSSSSSSMHHHANNLIHLPIRPYPTQVSWWTNDEPHHYHHTTGSSSSSTSTFTVQNQSLQINVAGARTIFDTIWQQYIRFDDDHEKSDNASIDNDSDIEGMVPTRHPSNHTVTTVIPDHSLVVITGLPTESPAPHHITCSVDVDATDTTTTTIDAAIEPHPTAPSAVLKDMTISRHNNDITYSNSSSPVLLSTHIPTKTTGIADHMVHRDRPGSNHNIPRNMAGSQQRQDRMISIEQMMEQEMKDIHTILIAMCLVTVSILIVMIYYMQNEQSSDSRQSSKNTNSRSKKSTVHSNTTNHHQPATFLHRTLLSNHQPPAAATEIPNDYMVVVSTTPTTGLDKQMSPLSTDTAVAQRSELYHRHRDDSWEAPTRPHVPPAISSHETMTPTLSPCSVWWQNRRRRTARHHHPSAGISNLGPQREPHHQRDRHFITPICDDRPVLSKDNHHVFDWTPPLPERPEHVGRQPEMTAAFTKTTTVPNARDIPDDPLGTTRRIVPDDATPTRPHLVTPTTAPPTQRDDHVTTTTPVLRFSNTDPPDHCSFVNDYW